MVPEAAGRLGPHGEPRLDAAVRPPAVTYVAGVALRFRPDDLSLHHLLLLEDVVAYDFGPDGRPWPDGTSAPRPSVVVIQAENGGRVGA